MRPHTLPLLATLLLTAPATAQVMICVDPGHGGSDPGAVGCGLQEADVNLDVGLRLGDLLEADPDLTPIYTRTSDATVSLAARTAFANDHGADRFASIHSNAFNGQASGIETYCYTSGSAASFDQRDHIQAQMIATWPLPDRGGKTAGFYVIANTAMPATLTELGFIDHCALDATYLGDPAQRQHAAEAHHAALRASLDLGATPPPDVTGELRGVVFEDQGVGTDDMSIRLPGATVTVSGGPGPDASTSAAPPDAAWVFDLAPGAWTVTATLAGFEPSSRGCAVTAGATAWCSVGLFPEEDDPPVAEPPPPDVPAPPPDLPPDAPEPADLPPDVGPELPMDVGHDAPAPVPDLPLPHEDAAPTFDLGAPAGLTPPPPHAVAELASQSQTRVTEVQSSGCHSAAPTSAPLWLLLALAALVLLRRRAPLLAALLLLTACAAPAPPPDHAAPLVLHDLAQLTPAAGYSWPTPSPDGAHIAVTTRRLDRLLVVPSAGGEPTPLVTGRRVGYAPTWHPDSSAIAYRAPHQSGSVVPLHAVAVDGRAAAPPRNPTPGRWVLVRDHQIYARHGSRERRLSADGDRHCCAVTSPDGRRVAWLGLSTGLHLFDLETGQHQLLGPGVQPAFAPTGDALLFVIPEDDGQRQIATTLVHADLRESPPLLRPLQGAPPLAEHPCFAADGAGVLFDAGGAIWSARL